MKNLFKTTTVFAGLSLFTSFSANAQWDPVGTNIYNTNAGNVGIGTGGSTGALDKLQVKGGNLLMDAWSGGNGSLYFGGHTDSGNNGLRLSYNNGTNACIDVKTAPGNGLIFRLDGSYGATERLRINQDGNIGISNATPLARLSVSGNVLITNTGSSPASAAYIRGNSAFSSALTPDYTWWNNDQTGIFHPAGDVIAFTNWGVEKMRIHSNGHVGINTQNPTAIFTVNGNVLIGDPATITLPVGYKLYVQTGIITEKVRVAIASSASWADYVFNKDYKLNDLSDVEAYIKAKKHLPNIPSAAEVVENGIDLGNMDAKLLEKIEELTLYLISQNKKLESLEHELIILKNK